MQVEVEETIIKEINWWNPRSPYTWNARRRSKSPRLSEEEFARIWVTVRATVDVPSGLSPAELEKVVHK